MTFPIQHLISWLHVAVASDLKRDVSRPSWWAPVREGSAIDVNSPLKKQKFQAKKPTTYTPGAGLVAAEAPVLALAPTIVSGVSGVSAAPVRSRSVADQQFSDHRVI